MLYLLTLCQTVLNKAEQNYFQVDKEALALVYGVMKFHMYLYGRQSFKLITDHKPLLAIFGPKAELLTLVAARLQMYAVILAAYSYSLEYRSTTNIGNADALSRLPVDHAPGKTESSILLTILTCLYQLNILHIVHTKIQFFHKFYKV